MFLLTLSFKVYFPTVGHDVAVEEEVAAAEEELGHY
jgi:hypothetical protein